MKRLKALRKLQHRKPSQKLESVYIYHLKGGLRSRAKVFIMECKMCRLKKKTWSGMWWSEKKKTYLLVGKAQLVLQDRLAINQGLHLIGKSIERLDKSLCEVRIIHSINGKCDGKLRIYQVGWGRRSIRCWLFRAGPSLVVGSTYRKHVGRRLNI